MGDTFFFKGINFIKLKIQYSGHLCRELHQFKKKKYFKILYLVLL